jgi:exo-beta-1,3-glucanase (GH17 family)
MVVSSGSKNRSSSGSSGSSNSRVLGVYILSRCLATVVVSGTCKSFRILFIDSNTLKEFRIHNTVYMSVVATGLLKAVYTILGRKNMERSK